MNKNTRRSTVGIWTDVFEKLDVSYSEKIINQGRLFELLKISFLEEIFPKTPASLLEVGCGTAFVSLYFAKRGFSVSCLDINKQILSVAKRNFLEQKAKGSFKVGDVERLPYKDSSFDIVTSFGLLEHFENPSIAICEMVRVLKSGGLFFSDIVPRRFSVQTFGNIFNSFAVLFFYMMKGKFRTAFRKALGVFRPPYYENSLSWQEYSKIMRACGLGKIKVNGNRPYPRLTLPVFLSNLYAIVLSKTMVFWRAFDRNGGFFPRFWGAGWWFWGYKR